MSITALVYPVREMCLTINMGFADNHQLLNFWPFKIVSYLFEIELLILMHSYFRGPMRFLLKLSNTYISSMYHLYFARLSLLLESADFIEEKIERTTFSLLTTQIFSHNQQYFFIFGSTASTHH